MSLRTVPARTVTPDRHAYGQGSPTRATKQCDRRRQVLLVGAAALTWPPCVSAGETGPFRPGGDVARASDTFMGLGRSNRGTSTDVSTHCADAAGIRRGRHEGLRHVDGAWPIEPRNLFNALCDAAGIRRVRLDDLRHTCATLLLAQGVDGRTIMELLGHRAIAVTMNIYTHVRLDSSARRSTG
jgi:hypothetical protein